MLNPAIDKVLDRCALVVVSTRMPSPMRDTDEGEKSGSRVTKVLQSCFNPEALRPLSKLKSAATRACRAVGTRLETLQAWTVVTEELDTLMAQLGKIHEQWDAETRVLAASISEQVELWAQANPNEAEAIRKLAPSAAEVMRRSKFLRTSFRLKSEDVLDQEALEAEMDSLLGKILYEMGQMLKDASLHKNVGKVYTSEAFDVLRRVGHKCRAMAFVDPLLQRIADALDDVQQRFAGQGRVTDLDALALHALIQQLLDTGKLLRSGLVVPQLATPAAAPVISATAGSGSAPTPVRRSQGTGRSQVAKPAGTARPAKPKKSAGPTSTTAPSPVVVTAEAVEASCPPSVAAEQLRQAQAELESAVLI